MESKSQDIIKLNPPDKSRGLPVMTALSERASVREFDTTSISIQDISDLLWAANGVNRPDEGKRTAPSAINAQDIDIYVFLKDAVCHYNAEEHSLIKKVNGDFRTLISAKQVEFANAPLFILIVSDNSKFKYGDDTQKLVWGAIDAGLVAENICVFCASVGFSSRPRASMEQDKITELLKLSNSQKLMLNVVVSYKK
ncbi:MAG TPA: SagB/ThcOx family dehydrogenase [Candidatus Kapabacteria bacterium]|nr:SagB/ThcOx family dehydrogenase [Candidatus Kapabacteria bacterium]